MAKRGRPTKYRIEFNEQARKLCLLRHTDAELAKFFDISVAVLNTWKKEYPDFQESIKAGKEIADADIVQRLYDRAYGYEHDDVEIKVISLGDNLGSEIVKVPVRKYYPPDVNALKFWLINRQRHNWTEKSEIGVTNKEGQDVNLSALSNDELKTLLQLNLKLHASSNPDAAGSNS